MVIERKILIPKVIICLLLLLLGGNFARAETFNDSDKQVIAQAEGWLNNIGTLKAHFMQVAADGNTADGTLFLKRPGFMRIEYEPPAQYLVIGTPSWLVYIDKELNQTSYVDIDSTPAGILVKPQVKLEGGNLRVTKIKHQPGITRLTVVNHEDVKQGQITLVFTNSPFVLRQWEIVDGAGQTTIVSLFDTRTGINLDGNLFEWR